MRLQKFAKSNPMIAYNAELKTKFKKIGKDFCTEVLKALSPNVKNHRYWYNAGGIAVSGDHGMMIEFHSGDFVHMFFNLDGIGGLGICYRRCYSMTDYTGDRNHWVTFPQLESERDMAKRLMGFISTDEKLEARV